MEFSVFLIFAEVPPAVEVERGTADEGEGEGAHETETEKQAESAAAADPVAAVAAVGVFHFHEVWNFLCYFLQSCRLLLKGRGVLQMRVVSRRGSWLWVLPLQSPSMLLLP